MLKNVCYVVGVDLLFVDVVKVEIVWVEVWLYGLGWVLIWKFGIEFLICVMVEVEDEYMLCEVVDGIVVVVEKVV